MRLMGGLGNQMFQYAAGKALAMSYNNELIVDTSFYKEKMVLNTKRFFELNSFTFEENAASQIFNQKYKIISFPIFTKVLILTRNHYGKINFMNKIDYRNMLFKKDFFSIPDNTYLVGYWQSEKYFRNIRNIIIQDYTLRDELRDFPIELSNFITQENTVSLHFRFGDYLRDRKTKKVHGVLDINYYKRAIELIRKKVKNPEFLVFTDEVDWFKSNLDLNIDYKIISGKFNLNNAQEMIAMSLCKHNIIANSSFSWWGAWLNKNPDKIVIAPKKWFNNPNVNTMDLIPNDWVLL